MYKDSLPGDRAYDICLHTNALLSPSFRAKLTVIEFVKFVTSSPAPTPVGCFSFIRDAVL
ncbi:hypothetical protein D3C81_2103920 [compost metagenome]